MIIIGTTALSKHGIVIRKSNDVDIMCPVESAEQYKEKGFDVVPVNQSVYNLLFTYSSKSIYATPDMIYTIKCSHLGWSNPSWQKHKKDVLILKQKGCKLIPELYEALLRWWKEDLGDKSFLNLDKSKEMFFNDFIEYEYDHDLLHELITHPEPPTYTKCLKDGKQVLIDKSKFDRLDFVEQVSMFREEITAIALERWYLKQYWFDRGITWMKAYSLALQKTITNLTKGWATDFIVLNLEHFVIPRKEDFDKVVKLLNLEEKYMSKFLGEEKAQVLLQEVVDAGVAEGLEYFSEDMDLEELFVENLVDGWGRLPKGAKHIEQDGGGEGGSEDCYAVFQWKDKFYRVDYNYYSYVGYENLHSENIYEVKPVEKTVTFYE